MATIDMRWKEGGCCAPFTREQGPGLTQCGLGRGLLSYQVASSSIQPFGQNWHGPKIGWVGGCALFWGKLSPHLTQSRLGQGLPPYQVASQSIQLFGHDGYGPKTGGLYPLGEGELGPHLSQVAWAEAYLHTKQYPDASSHLATTNIGRKLGAVGRGAWSPSNTMLLVSRATSLASGILKHPAIWPQQIYNNVGHSPPR